MTDVLPYTPKSLNRQSKAVSGGQFETDRDRTHSTLQTRKKERVEIGSATNYLDRSSRRQQELTRNPVNTVTGIGFSFLPLFVVDTFAMTAKTIVILEWKLWVTR